MSKLPNPKVAIVHEWFTSYAGSEKVVEQILKLFPGADVFCVVDFLEPDLRQAIGLENTHTSFIQRIPASRRYFRSLLMLMPLAIEQFDMDAYDIVISSSHAVAKGILTRPDQLHISYIHTPIRYGWEFQHQYLKRAGLTRGVKSALARVMLHYLRLWDLASAHRVDAFVANSRFIARRIRKTYRRPARVIYPPVKVECFQGTLGREDFYLTVCRFVPYKRMDLIIEAFSQLRLPLVVIGDGPLRSQLQSRAASNIRFLGYQPDATVIDYLQRCKGFVYAAEEDFGITLVEAQAAGAPVIAYGRGGATETVIEGETGILFQEQTVPSLVDAIKSFETRVVEFESTLIRRNAEQYSVSRYRHEFRMFVLETWGKFQRGDALE
mgnify:CR=1 FL=1